VEILKTIELGRDWIKERLSLSAPGESMLEAHAVTAFATAA
jgi:hypothetical protein